MPQITRRITTALIAAALIAPISVSIAPAQSSFGSSDFLTSSTVDSKVSELEKAYRKYGEHLGLTRDATLERVASALTQRAVNGEFVFEDGYYGFTESGIEYTILQIPVSEVDTIVAEIEIFTTSSPAVSPPHGFSGISAKRQGDLIYITLAVAEL